MNVMTDALADALALYRAGDLRLARATAEARLQTAPDARLSALAGLLACQLGDPAGGVPHLERALAAMPSDLSTRINLGTALIATGNLARCIEICRGGADLKLRRLGAYAHQQLGNLQAAIDDYRAVVAVVDSDFESWNNLGNLLASTGDADGAIEAFEQSIALRPDIPMLYINYSKALNDWERHDDRQKVMRAAAARFPTDPEVQLELGLAEAAARDFDAADQAYRSAIRLSDGFTPAYIEYGVLLENLNRLDDLAALVAEAEAKGFSADEIGFIRAWSLRRQGRFAEALSAAEAVAPTVDPTRRHQLLGEIRDRLSDAAGAFVEFTAMNEAVQRMTQPMRSQGDDYRTEVAAATARLTAERVAGWTPVAIESRPPSPVFIIGFPRSGTTLTDTLLMNIPEFHVLEELPIVRHVEAALGEPSRIDTLNSGEANALRARYFEVLNEISPPAPGQTVVDKFPLHMARMPIIHRLFPDAKIVFVERHPCDVVLSCFMSNFQPNRAMVHFLDILEAARLYNTVFEAWTRAEALLPLNVHRIRYERMVENLEGEMRSLLDFLGIPWNPAVLDNRASALGRGHIQTASYSQVTEPIYRRSAGRWQRYREQLAPILPILAPWADRLGYDL